MTATSSSHTLGFGIVGLGMVADFHAQAIAHVTGGRLVGVGLFDETPNALSAAFFFYDPEYAAMSPGTANVLSLVDEARASGRDHVYLGFRVAGCRSLRYKASFRPHELLHGRPAAGEPVLWREAPEASLPVERGE